MSHYADAVLDFRRRKDEHFRAGKGPVDASTFGSLSYFPPDPAWSFRVPLVEQPLDASAEFTLETNTGQSRVMARCGTFSLSLPGGERTLLAFAPLGSEEPQRVFIPFRDTTSGTQTYGAGRYLDAPVQRIPPGEASHGQGQDVAWVDVDFNMAYHPYCAYGDGWTCPLPPRENWLPDAVLAGERLPTGES